MGLGGRFRRRGLLGTSGAAIAGKPAPTGGRREIAVFFCRRWLASERWLEDSSDAIAGKPAPTGGGGRLRYFSVGAGLPASSALKTAALPSRASPLPQGEGQIAMFFCRRWLASELCLEDSGAAIAGKPAPTGGGADCGVFL